MFRCAEVFLQAKINKSQNCNGMFTLHNKETDT